MTSLEAWRPKGPRFIPLAPLPFIAVALLPIAQSWSSWSPELTSDPGRWLWWTAVPLIPDVALPLIGAALVIRHPSARRHQPWLLLGAILLAVQVLGRMVRVEGWLLELFPSSSDPFVGVSLVGTAYSILVSFIGSLGLLSLARGLQQARGPDRSGAGRMIGILVMFATAVAAAEAYFNVTALAYIEDTIDTSGLIPLVALATVATAVKVVAIGWLGIVAARGWADGESPPWGWALAATGSLLMLLPFVVNLVLADVGVLTEGSAAWVVLSGVGLIMPVATVLLLAAFVVGLPASEDIRWYDLEELDRAAS